MRSPHTATREWPALATLEKVLAATKTKQSHKKDLRDWPEALPLPTVIQLILTLL